MNFDARRRNYRLDVVENGENFASLGDRVLADITAGDD